MGGGRGWGGGGSAGKGDQWAILSWSYASLDRGWQYRSSRLLIVQKERAKSRIVGDNRTQGP